MRQLVPARRGVASARRALFLVMVAFCTMLAAWFVCNAATLGRRKRLTFASNTATDRARAFVVADADGFVASFSALDLIARGAPSGDAYRARVAGSLREPTFDERTAVNTAINAMTTPLKYNPHDVVVVADAAVEGGMPHTRGTFVFLPEGAFGSPSALRATLAHELVHIDQRARPQRARAWATEHGYAPVDGPRPARSRANPDLDGLQWAFRGSPVAFLYASDRPESLRDGRVVGASGYEHPYENQAYAAEP